MPRAPRLPLRFLVTAAAAVVLALPAAATIPAPAPPAAAVPAAGTPAVRALPPQPLQFVPNFGQFASGTRFVGSVPGATVRFEKDAIRYQLRRGSVQEARRGPEAGAPRPLESLEIRATFPGARPAAAVEGVDPTGGLNHFYLGDDPARWRTEVPGYAAVRMRGLYPGIDLQYHGNGRQLEYDFIVAPGADPRRIRVRYDGIERLRVTEDGELELTTRFGTCRESAPVAYQQIGGERHIVPARYRRIDDRTFAFVTGPRLDPSVELVIDPVLKYSTLLGGLSYDEVHEIVSDIPGNAYVVGGTMSPDFPATGTPVPSTDYSVYLCKLAPNGGSQVYSVYLGGSASQIGYGLRIDAAGNAYIAGTTGSNDFPTTAGCFDASFNGSNPGELDLFVAKFSPTGTLLYSTYLGGSVSDTGGRLALDQNGIAWIVGNTGSTNFPTTPGAYDLTTNGFTDIFVAGMNCAGGGSTDLVYGTYLGGNADDEAHDIEVDWTDDVYVAGATRSSNFPSVVGPAFNGSFDAFAARFKPQGLGPADLSVAFEVGGSGEDYGKGVEPSGTGEFFLTGITKSTDFQPANGYQQTYGGGLSDAFLVRSNWDASLIYWGTYIGGSGEDHANDLALGPQWNPTVIGFTKSTDFPLDGTPFQSSPAGDYDMFLKSFLYGATPYYATYLGGTQLDVPYAITEDTGGRQYIAGNTQTSDYPLTPGAFDTSYNGGAIDVAVTKFATLGADTCETCVSPPDTCCAKAPPFDAVEHPYLSNRVMVATRAPTAFPIPVSVVVYDLASPLPSPLEDNEWTAITRWSGPNSSWNIDSLGTVFGLTVDEYGNIFVTHTSAYSPDAKAKVFGNGYGGVYRIDASTAKITTFCVLPNALDASVNVPNEQYPGLGNISYDCRNRQFFVTNLEDGRIYRIKPNGVNGATGTVQETFDPMAPDNGLAGWAPDGERLWGVQVHGDRVYYAVWAETVAEPNVMTNQIRSVGLLPSGAFDTSLGSDRHELWLPPRPATSESNPVSDISFSADGKMLLGERGMFMLTIPTAHEARVLEYQCVAGCWLPTNPFDVGIITPENAAGGVDYDRFPYTGQQYGRVWATGDALHGAIPPYTDVIYGIQGFRPTGGSIQNSMLVDSNGDPMDGDKHSLGDVEVPGCVNFAVGSVCGRKWNDFDRDGVKDAGEPYLAGWTMVLSGPGGPYYATSDGSGAFCFDNVPPGNYTLVEQLQGGWLQTAPAGGSYNVTVVGGQTVLNRDFGNFACNSGPGGTCTPPPPFMVAWWPFDEPVTATSAADVTHMSPAKNVANLVGAAAITAGGHSGRMLCVPNELDYAVVPHANTFGFQFGGGSFAADAWVMLNPGGGPRLLIEKRQDLSGVMRGFALGFVGLQARLELGNGSTTQTVNGPILTASTWHHLAFSVDRSTGQGRWYLNGVVQPAFNFAPLVGPIASNADVYIGRTSPAFGASAPLMGCVDDLEVFASAPNANPLPAASVAALYAAGAAAKCADIVRMPESTTICANQASVQVCFTIQNAGPVAQTYQWSVSALPVGPGCTVAGPANITPGSGSVTLNAGAQQTICLTVPRPPGLTAQNATACFEVLVVSNAGKCTTVRGKIRNEACLCPGGGVGLPGGPIGVLGRGAPVQIPIPWHNPCGGLIAIPYTARVIYEPVGHEDPLELSLNGLPPGEPVFGELVDGSGTGSGVVEISASFPGGYDLMAHYRIVLEADLDGNGSFETRVDERQIYSTYEDEAAAGVGGEVAAFDATRLAVSPNPFFRGSSVAFSLARPDDATLAVYDLGGRLVRELHRGRLSAGMQRFEWNGRDAGGRPAAAGIYFVRLHSSRLRLDAKLVKLK